MSAFGQVTREAQLRLGLSQSALASRVGCSTNTMKLWIDGSRVPSNKRTLGPVVSALAELFGFDVDWYRGLAEDRRASRNMILGETTYYRPETLARDDLVVVKQRRFTDPQKRSYAAQYMEAAEEIHPRDLQPMLAERWGMEKHQVSSLIQILRDDGFLPAFSQNDGAYAQQVRTFGRCRNGHERPEKGPCPECVPPRILVEPNIVSRGRVFQTTITVNGKTCSRTFATIEEARTWRDMMRARRYSAVLAHPQGVMR